MTREPAKTKQKLFGKRHSGEPTIVQAIGNAGLEISYRTGGMVFRQGAPSGGVYYISKGRIQLSVTSKEGKEAIIASLHQGDFLGEGSLTGQPNYLATAKALSASTLLRIERSAMLRLLKDPRVSEAFTAHLLSRNLQVEADLVDQMFNSSERRLARALLMLASVGKEGEMQTVLPRVTQEALAAQVGTTRGRINHFMNKFRKLGYIEYNGELKVHSSLLNIVVHE